MKPTSQQLKDSSPFFWGLLCFWLAGFITIVATSKAGSFEWLTPFHSPASDYFFQYFTYVGDGLFAVALALLLVLLKQRVVAFVLFFGYSVSGILAQLIKHSIYSPRPFKYFQSIGKTIHNIEGVTLQFGDNSMPSGHTATAFALATALVLSNSWWAKKWWLALMMALLVGYSRMYLSNHFLQDVLAGSVLGAFATIAGYVVLQKWNPVFITGARNGVKK